MDLESVNSKGLVFVFLGLPIVLVSFPITIYVFTVNMSTKVTLLDNTSLTWPFFVIRLCNTLVFVIISSCLLAYSVNTVVESSAQA